MEEYILYHGDNGFDGFTSGLISSLVDNKTRAKISDVKCDTLNYRILPTVL